MGVLGLFSYINLKEGKTFKTATLYYLVYYIENIIMLVLIIIHSTTSDITNWEFCLFVIPMGLLHLLLNFSFYLLFHPSNTVCPPMEIHCCLKK